MMHNFKPSSDACTVCGRKSTDLPIPHLTIKGSYTLPHTCPMCMVWYGKETSIIAQSKFPEGEGEYEPCLAKSPYKYNHLPNGNVFTCMLPQGHEGGHVAFNFYGVVRDAWKLEKGMLGLPHPHELRKY